MTRQTEFGKKPSLLLDIASLNSLPAGLSQGLVLRGEWLDQNGRGLDGEFDLSLKGNSHDRAIGDITLKKVRSRHGFFSVRLPGVDTTDEAARTELGVRPPGRREFHPISVRQAAGGEIQVEWRGESHQLRGVVQAG